MANSNPADLYRHYLQMAQRSLEATHGQHRQPDPAPSGGAAEASGAGDPGTRGGAARSHAAVARAITGNPTPVYVPGNIAIGAGKGYYTGPMIGPAARVGIAYRAMPAPPIPDAGIRVGEIIGWRAWRVYPSERGAVFIYSVAADTGWLPRNPTTGDPDEPSAGVHAWRDERRATRYLSEIPFYGIYTIVIGEVALWGTVIEHDHGYRAEYARPVSFDRIYPQHDPDLLARLRTTYLEERA